MIPDKEWRDKVDKSLEDLGSSTARIEKAIVGDEGIGLTGIVARLAKVERWIRKADLRMAGLAGGAGVLIWLIEHLLFNKP